MRTVLFALAMLTLSSALPAAEGQNRDAFVEIVDLLRAPYMVERIEGIREAGSLSDADLVDEFRIVDRLVAVANNDARNTRERAEALKSLVLLAERRIAEPAEVLGRIARLIANRQMFLGTRIDALQVITSMDPPEDLSRDDRETYQKLQRGIIELARNTNNPVSLRASAYAAIGNLGGRDAGAFLLGQTEVEEIRALRIAAMEGFYRWVETLRSRSQELMARLTDILRKREGGEDAAVRLWGLRAMERLLRNGAEPVDEKDLVAFLGERMRLGNDDELIAASKAILHVPLPEVVPYFLAEVQKDRSPEAHLAVVKSAIEFYLPMAEIVLDRGSSAIEIRKAREQAATITASILAPLPPLEGAPEELRLAAILGLGAVPYVFDRQAAVASLLQALSSGNDAIRQEAEASLLRISRQARPPRTAEDAIDVQAWQRWFQANRDWLKPDLVPWDHEARPREDM